MLALIQGEEVELPVFDFKTGKRKVGKKIRIEKNSPIIIEGIHALNDRLTSLVPKHQKFKIYISPLSEIKIDGHNPINQICGYLVSSDPTYITNHNNARALITQVEREDILEAITEEYIEKM